MDKKSIIITSEKGALVFSNNYIDYSRTIKTLLTHNTTKIVSSDENILSHYTTDLVLFDMCMSYCELINSFEDRINVDNFEEKKRTLDYLKIDYSVVLSYVDQSTDNNLLHFYCYLKGLITSYASEFITQICKYQVGLNILDLLGSCTRSDNIVSILELLSSCKNVDNILIGYALQIHQRLIVLLQNIPKNVKKDDMEKSLNKFFDDYGGIQSIGTTFLKILESSLQKHFEVLKPSLTVSLNGMNDVFDISGITYKLCADSSNTLDIYNIVLNAVSSEGTTYSVCIDCSYYGCAIKCKEPNKLFFCVNSGTSNITLETHSYVNIVSVIEGFLKTKYFVYSE